MTTHSPIPLAQRHREAGDLSPEMSTARVEPARTPRAVVIGLVVAFGLVAAAFVHEVAERGGTEYVCAVPDMPSSCEEVER